MSVGEFEKILKKLDPYTDYVYLHIKGEPLLHPKLEKILDVCRKYKKQVNITTNGVLLKEKAKILLNSGVVRQINISLHSENHKEKYLKDIFEAVELLSSHMHIVYRLWTLNDFSFDAKSTRTVNKIMEYYHLSIGTVEKIYTDMNIEIDKNIYINKANQFIWPDVENHYCESKGYCHALKDHIGILSDGTVVPCCLDGEGIINLGNILTMNIDRIFENPKIEAMRKGFENRQVAEELCKHCNFKEQFNR
jgi:radical SAM domain protein